MKEKDEEFVDWATNIAQAKANLLRIKDVADVVMAEHETRAKVMRNYFLELVKSGFKEKQALEIVKEHGWLGR